MHGYVAQLLALEALRLVLSAPVSHSLTSLVLMGSFIACLKVFLGSNSSGAKHSPIAIVSGTGPLLRPPHQHSESQIFLFFV